MTDRPVVLVTGSRTGIGRFLAGRFLDRGDRVEGCSRGEAGWAREGYVHTRADVTDEAAVRGLVEAIRARHGRLDAVVNNAGAAAMNHALLTPASTFDRLMAVNARGTFLVCREAARLMQAQRSGRIVNLTTVAVPLALEGEAAYVASKAAVEGLTRVLAGELKPFGITVNAVGPGPVDTDLTRGVPKEALDRLTARLPHPEAATLDAVWAAVDRFTRPGDGVPTGQVVYLGWP